jgi:cell division protein FtsB
MSYCPSSETNRDEYSRFGYLSRTQGGCFAVYLTLLYLKTVMLTKSKQKLSEIYGRRAQLQDVRVLGLFLFLIIVLLTSWSGVKTIQSNYSLQKQISQLTQENQIQELKNNDLQLQNEYYNTNQYLELSARQNFGLAAPGETELLVPQSVALAQLVPVSNQAPTTTATTLHQPTYQKNFNAWIDFLLHRQTSND